MRYRYIVKEFREESLKIIGAANSVCAEYRAQGFDLTLRQLFYQFVARGWIPNTERSYKRIGSIINDARLAGHLDWRYIVDRTRELEANSHWDRPTELIDAAADQYMLDRWAGQPTRVEVWIEKDALLGVIGGVCDELDVPYFSCRGYTSQSAMYEAGQRLLDYEGEPVILHLGDHDPSGIDMTRDIQDRLNLFTFGRVDVQRIALTMEQVEELNPPPNPTKLSDSRAAGYIAEYGHESWELDAIPPDQLTELIRTNVEDFRIDSLYNETVAAEAADRERLTEIAGRWDDVLEFLDGPSD